MGGQRTPKWRKHGPWGGWNYDTRKTRGKSQLQRRIKHWDRPQTKKKKKKKKKKSAVGKKGKRRYG